MKSLSFTLVAVTIISLWFTSQSFSFALALQTDFPQSDSTTVIVSSDNTEATESAVDSQPTTISHDGSTLTENTPESHKEEISPTTIRLEQHSTTADVSSEGSAITTTVASDESATASLTASETNHDNSSSQSLSTSMSTADTSHAATMTTTVASSSEISSTLAVTTSGPEQPETTGHTSEESSPAKTDAVLETTTKVSNLTDPIPQHEADNSDANEGIDYDQQCIFEDSLSCKGNKFVCWGKGEIDCDMSLDSNQDASMSQPSKCVMSKTLKCNIDIKRIDCQGKASCEPITGKAAQEQPLKYWEVAMIAAFTAAAGVTVVAIITAVYISWAKLKVNPESSGSIGPLSA